MALAKGLRPLFSMARLPRLSPCLVQHDGRRYKNVISEKKTKRRSADSFPEAIPELNQSIMFHPMGKKNITSSQEDPSLIYDPEITKFINSMMWDGKKAMTRGIFQKALSIVKKDQLKKWQEASEKGKEKIELNPINIFKEAFSNVFPVMGVARLKRGGVAYQVPVPLSERRKRFLATKWMIDAAYARSTTKYRADERLALEIIDALNHTGGCIRKKHELHKLAAANRAYAHYRWF